MEEIKFVDAYARGVVEYGYISLEIGDVDINITSEQYSDGFQIYLLDDPEHKELLEAHGVEFQDDEKIIGPDEFINDLYDFYQNTTMSNR